MDGWFKCHRQIIDSAVFDNPKLLKVWIWCLANASHKDRNVLYGKKEIHLKSGQFICGRRQASDKLKMNDRTFYDYIKMLESLEMIRTKTNNKYTLVTIAKWAFYQDTDGENQHQSTTQSTTNSNTNKNVKNVKNNIYKYIYRDSPELNKAIHAFIEFRKKIRKPMTERAIELMLKRLDKLSSDESEQIAILDNSILNGWSNIYPLKKDIHPQELSASDRLDDLDGIF